MDRRVHATTQATSETRSSSTSNLRTNAKSGQDKSADKGLTAHPSDRINFLRSLNGTTTNGSNTNTNTTAQRPHVTDVPRLAPDRLAAARERIRLKAEQRKVSGSSNHVIAAGTDTGVAGRSATIAKPPTREIDNRMALDGAADDVEDDDVEDDFLPERVDSMVMESRIRNVDMGVGKDLYAAGETSELDWEAL